MCLSDPAHVLEVGDDAAEATVWLRGQRRRLSLAPLTLAGHRVAPGDWVLASLGMAIEAIDETDARALLALLEGEDPS